MEENKNIKNFIKYFSNNKKSKYLFSKKILKDIFKYIENNYYKIDQDTFLNIYKYLKKHHNENTLYEFLYSGRKLIERNDFEFIKNYKNKIKYEDIEFIFDHINIKNFNSNFIQYLLENKMVHPNYLMRNGCSIPEKFLRRYSRTIDWDLVSEQNLSKSFIKKYIDKLNCDLLYNNKNIPEDLLKIIHKNI